ncbi:MAG TPA: hypothetical protein VNT01_05140, partial [Symbiobacteriaceae bacterium]|nr:hypothetical protein [Symbiobacteriaceae bacterium]
MAQMPEQDPGTKRRPAYRSAGFWLGGLLPLALLAGLIALFAWGGSGLIEAPAAPVEEVAFERVTLQPSNINIKLRNTGPAAVTIAQVIVDDAVWPARFDPSATIGRLATANLDLGYPWVAGERHEIKLVTTNGIILVHEIPVAAMSPTADSRSVFGFGVMGLYVGIVPIGLGLLWFPFLKKTGKGTLTFVLALTVGLLAFLLVDT